MVVCAAVIERNGRFLITRRQQGVHLAGFWEFPGGKCDAGETLAACLARELREELAVESLVGHEIFSTTHPYADRSVELHFLQCEIVGEPSPKVGQDMQWVGRTELPQLLFPPADIEFIRWLTREEGV